MPFRRASFWPWLLLAAMLVAGGFYFSHRARQADRELPVYVTGGERMARGEEIYRRGADAKPFTYPPFAAVPFVLFAALPAAWQPAAWFAVNLLILVGVLRWLHRWAAAPSPGHAPPRLLPFWLLTGLFGGRHVLSVLTNQSHDLLILGLVALTAAAWCRQRSTAGIWAGLGAATKATPLLFLGLFGLHRRWLAAAALAGAAAAATLLPDLLLPRDDGRSWWRAWYEVNLAVLEIGGTARAEGAWNSHSVLNQSLSGMLVRLFRPVDTPDPDFVLGGAGDVLLFELPAAALRALSLALQAGVVLALALGSQGAMRNARGAADAAAVQRITGLGEVAAFACGMVLLSPQSSKSHFCIWLFPVAFLANEILRRRRDPAVIACGAAALVLGLLSKEMLGRATGNVLLAFGNVTWCTVLLLVATVRCLRARA